MGRKLLLIGGYSAAFTLFLVVFMVLNLPVERLRDWIEVYARNRMGLDLTIGAIDQGFVTHTLKNVKIKLPSRYKPDPSVDAAITRQLKAPKHIAMKRISIRVGLAQALRRRPDVAFEIGFLRGELTGGRFRLLKGRGYEFKIGQLRNLSLTELPILDWYLKGIIRGTLGGHIDFKNPGSWAKVNASVLLRIKNAYVRFAKLKIGENDLPLRDAFLGTCTIQAETMTKLQAKIRRGRRYANDLVLVFKKVNCDGDDVEVRVEQPSYIEFREPLRMSQINLTLQIGFGKNPEFLKKNTEVKLFSQSRQYRRTFFSGDFFGLNIYGYLFKPRFRLRRPRIRGVSTKTSGRRPPLRRTIRNRPVSRTPGSPRPTVTGSHTFKPVSPLRGRHLRKPPPPIGKIPLLHRRDRLKLGDRRPRRRPSRFRRVEPPDDDRPEEPRDPSDPRRKRDPDDFEE
ncbi:MAG: type II secretion system protein GspN [Myxococcales bacterium]|nr:type II secretion system protein GspN [Myxococcales bacterium]